MTLYSSSKASRKSPSVASGFALIATISVMVLLVMIALAMLSLSTTELRASRNGVAMGEARANARMALMIALGELQKTLGPDARISARAETLVKDSRIPESLTPDNYRAWWVGAMHSDSEKNIGQNGEAVVWLVSGLNGSLASFVESDPVIMFGDNSADLDKYTAGNPIKAGRVKVKAGQGAYAYIVDDNGMKAQIVPSDPELRNDLPPGDMPGGGVLPGSYDLAILNGAGSLAGANPDDYKKLFSLSELPFLGADRDIVRSKRFDYTKTSLGVLADVRKGELKKDLTIAFENSSVFASVFPSNDPERYLLVDSKKLQQASDLKQHGYIHWKIFRDYYNMKKHIKTIYGNEVLDGVFFSKQGYVGNTSPDSFHTGKMGPHVMASGAGGEHSGQPYGDYKVLTSHGAQNYKHSPICSILSHMQENAWLDYTAPTATKPGILKTHVQLWTSHYNPYNVHLRLRGSSSTQGPRLMNYPMPYFSLGSHMVKHTGLSNKRETHVNRPITLKPGRSHLMGFRRDIKKGRENDRGDTDGGAGGYSDAVKDLILENIWDEKKLSSTPLTGKMTFDVNFRLDRPTLLHGCDHDPGNFEVAQFLYSPFTWENVFSRPGKKISQSVSANELNENSMASISLTLRSTRESDQSVRPLVDANIRAVWLNPKWDSPLNLPLLAAYSPEGEGEALEKRVQVNTQDAPRGYTYWGSGRNPADGYERVILFDIPRDDLVSLGQLQHANAGRFSYEPTYIVGNSYANPRISLYDWKASVSDTFSTNARGLAVWKIPGQFNLYDASYLVNEVLWDSYIFTTIPQVRDNRTPGEPTNDYAALLDRDTYLPNPRFIPYVPRGSKFDSTTLQDSGDDSQGSFFHNAGHLLVDGMFNINSTSVDAWEAFLSGTHNLPVQKMDTSGKISGYVIPDGVRFPRVKANIGKGTKTNALDENYWTGYRELTQYEVRDLAEKIVEEIKERGPFLSLGEFVNRKISPSGGHGESGTLQAALDATVNKNIDASFSDDAKHPAMPANAQQAAGFPGQLLQGDILQALSPYMQPRSDNFTIRAYGESRDSGGEILARAWCEATVQRFPDPVKQTGTSLTPLQELARPSSPFGRKFRVTAFRWLSSDEI